MSNPKCVYACRVRQYPADDDYCIVNHQSSPVKMRDGTVMYIPCSSPSCPVHCVPAREEWARRIKREMEMSPHSLSVVMPVGPILNYDELSRLWKGAKEAWRYILSPWRYIFVPEIQSHRLHIHSVIHTASVADQDAIKAAWRKFLKKKVGIDAPGLTAYANDSYPEYSTGQYIMKVGRYKTKEHEIQLPQKGWWRRHVFASIRYGMAPASWQTGRVALS